MARLTLFLKGTQPGLNEKGKIELKDARNPILTLQKIGASPNGGVETTAVPARTDSRSGDDPVVPIDLRMGDGVRGLILSGANACGKTVALKTLGLLALMAQSGLPIPVSEGSEMAIFQDIFAVIGDEQNIEENLSTFSSHLLHLNGIAGKAGPNSLLLLDELEWEPMPPRVVLWRWGSWIDSWKAGLSRGHHSLRSSQGLWIPPPGGGECGR